MRAGDAERCHRCGGESVNWCAASPLWNLVMRGGSIDGEALHDDMVCIGCFVALAEDAGLATGQWRLSMLPEPLGVEHVTPSGRTWDSEQWLWREPSAAELVAVPRLVNCPICLETLEVAG